MLSREEKLARKREYNRRYYDKRRVKLSTVEAEFMRHVRVTDGCWSWQGNRNLHGYGRWQNRGKTWVSSRASYTLFIGPIPGDMLVCHHCDNPQCVRPDHLFLGTYLDNTRDRQQKGRSCRPHSLDRRGEKNSSAKLDTAKVIQIREAVRNNPNMGIIGTLAKEYGVSFSTIWRVVTGHRWKHVA